MSLTAFVELEDGNQVFFDSVYEALKYAKKQEKEARHSVELVAITDESTSLEDQNITVYQGQRLRHLIRSVDDTSSWIRAQIEVAADYEERLAME